MKKAENVEELIDALDTSYNYDNYDNFDVFYEEFQKYYVKDTIKSRMGDEFSDPIKEIFMEIMLSRKSKSFLFLGHSGCGKSTELIRFRRLLQDKEYIPFIIDTNDDLDKNNVEYVDFLALILDKLLNIAQSRNIVVDKSILEKIENFWGEEIITKVIDNSRNLKVDAGIGGKVKDILNVLHISAGISSEIKRGHQTKKEIRTVITTKLSKLIECIEDVAELIGSKKLVLIFENLDKVELQTIGNIFKNNSSALTSFSFNTVYTFPISLYYSTEYAQIFSAYKVSRLPMIIVTDIDRNKNEEGINVLKEIIEKRAKLELFEEGVIEEAILMSGGAIRILLRLLTNASLKACIMDDDVIRKRYLESAISEMVSEYTKRLNVNDLKWLKEIINSDDENKRKVTNDTEYSTKLFHNQVLLEYNGERWFDVNPLAKKFIEDLGERFE